MKFEAELVGNVYGVRVRLRVPKEDKLGPVQDLAEILALPPAQLPDYHLLQVRTSKKASVLVLPVFKNLEVGPFLLGGAMMGSALRFWIIPELDEKKLVGIDVATTEKGDWETIYGKEVAA